MSSGSSSYMYEAVNTTNYADLTSSTPRSSTCWYSTLKDMEAQAASLAKLKEEEKQKKKDGAILPRVMTALTVKVLLKELSDECGSEYSSEEDKEVALATVLSVDMISDKSDESQMYESDVEVSDEEGGS